MHKQPNHQIVLGFDFGLKKIGVAVGQLVTQTATPLTLLKSQNGTPDWQEIEQIIIDWAIDGLIIGLPLNMDGTEQPITKQAKKFGRRLQARFHLPIYFIDERLTTVAAKDIMHTRANGKKRFEPADSISAQLIVESWLRSQ